MLPYSASTSLPEGLESVDTGNAPSRPRSAVRMPRAAEMEISSGVAWRLYGGGEPQSERMQALTAQLHAQVLDAQQRLSTARVGQQAALRSQTGWMQRAMRRAGLNAEQTAGN